MPTAVLEKIKLVVFDVDGVILDIIDAIRQSVAEALEKYKIQASLQDTMQEASRVMELAQTMPIPQIILNSKELLDIGAFADLTVLKKLRIAASIYSRFRTLKDQCKLFPHIEEVILGLHAKGYKLAILSNNKKSYVQEALKKQNLDQYFSLIIGFNEVTKTKPDPEGLLKILEEFKIKAENALFIGDMMTDIQCGRGATVKTIAVASGLTEKSKLEGEKPFLLVNNIAELKTAFGL